MKISSEIFQGLITKITSHLLQISINVGAPIPKIERYSTWTASKLVLLRDLIIPAHLFLRAVLPLKIWVAIYRRPFAFG